MASHQQINHSHPQHGQVTSPGPINLTVTESKVRRVVVVPLDKSGESNSQESTIPPYGLEYAFFTKAYQLIDKQYGQLPEYRGISQIFQEKARMAQSNHGRVTWTSFLRRPGQECRYLEALHELTHLLATMMLETREDRDAMKEIVRLASGVVDHRRTFEPLDHSHHFIVGKWEHVRDALQKIC